MGRNYFGNVEEKEIGKWLKKNTIHSDVSFDSLEYVKKTSKDGKPYEGLELKFSKDIDGETYRFEELIMPVNEAWANGDEEVIDQMYDNLNRKLKHIAEAVGLDFEKVSEKLASPTFEGSATKFAQIISSRIADKKFHLKIFNSKGYAALPRFPKFIQEDKPGVECILEFTTWEEQNMKSDAPKGGDIATMDDVEEEDYDSLTDSLDTDLDL